LRELHYAAEAKGRSEWAQVEVIAEGMMGTTEARKRNPYRRPKRRQVRRGPVSEQESAMAWAVLDRFFGQKHRN
jgi:hypothetical protein